MLRFVVGLCLDGRRVAGDYSERTGTLELVGRRVELTFVGCWRGCHGLRLRVGLAREFPLVRTTENNFE